MAVLVVVAVYLCGSGFADEARKEIDALLGGVSK